MKLQELFEAAGNKKSSAFLLANVAAEEMFGEFGILTCDEDSMSKIVSLKKANKMAEKLFGEFGFATLSDEQAEELLNGAPELINDLPRNVLIAYLKKFANQTINKELYDNDETFASALLAVDKGFEFPDWSGRKVSEFIKAVEKQ